MNDHGAAELGYRYEGSLSAERRKIDGVHYTPAALAGLVVDVAIEELGSPPALVCDPTCGGGAFLLAAADRLLETGADPWEIVNERLFGADIDVRAVDLARSALIQWAQARSGSGGEGPLGSGPSVSISRQPSATRSLPDLTANLVVADVLDGADALWTDTAVGGFDLVIGNPPFLSQLSTRTVRSREVQESLKERLGIAGYADTASLLMLDATTMVRDGGVVAMIQPQSFLSARDTGRVRAALLHGSELRTLWASDQMFFDASIRVCAVVVRPRRSSSGRDAGLQSLVNVLWSGDKGSVIPSREYRVAVPSMRGRSVGDRSVDVSPAGETSVGGPSMDSPWGPMFARSMGIPEAGVAVGPRLSSIATSTAGFRDEFYALVDASFDVAEDVSQYVTPDASAEVAPRDRSADSSTHPRLLTVGMIDPGVITWGVQPRRLGGRMRTAPRVDLERLGNEAPKVARWVSARLVPKVLVATQTRIVEAVVDADGRYVPVTPTISVEPLDGPDGRHADLWQIAAALMAPTVSARALATHMGTGLSAGTLRWSAKSVLDIELPSDEVAWNHGASVLHRLATVDASERPALLAELGATMCSAHGVAPDGELFHWWHERVLRSFSERSSKVAAP